MGHFVHPAAGQREQGYRGYSAPCQSGAHSYPGLGCSQRPQQEEQASGRRSCRSEVTISTRATRTLLWMPGSSAGGTSATSRDSISIQRQAWRNSNIGRRALRVAERAMVLE
eukprot:1711767-Pleurochrysis_carterae.AAC.1